jgi:3-oxoacyl-[acyl-carrier protein] reductase
MSKQFAGKIALVTGGSRGIGESISRHFAERGANVVIGYRSGKEVADALAADLVKQGVQAIAVAGDVAKPGDCQKIVDAAVAKFGRIDILVNNAGISARKTYEEMTHEEFTKVMETNVLSVFMMIKSAVPHMKAGGRIINISSRLAFIGIPGGAPYSASKAAVNQITANFAFELGAKGITVNGVAPGLIETEMTAKTIPDRKEMLIKSTPLGRIGQPDDIAGAVMMFASEESKWITGRTIRCDGGIH